jgi:hypothetical protein
MVEEIGQSAPESQRKSFVEEVQEGVDERGRQGDHAQSQNLFQLVGTLWMKRGRFRSTIALTIPPLTEAM